MTSAVQEEVVRLDVTVNEAEAVDVLDGEGGFYHVELSSVLGQGILLHQKGHQVTPGEELHHEVEVERILKAEKHLDHPLMVRLHEDVPFSPHVG